MQQAVQGALQQLTEENTVPVATEFVVVLQERAVCWPQLPCCCVCPFHTSSILVRSLSTEVLWWKSCPEASSKSHLLLHVQGLPVKARLLFRVRVSHSKALPRPLKQDLWVLRSCMILHFSSRCSANSSHRDSQIALCCSAHLAACDGSAVHLHSFQTSGNAAKQDGQTDPREPYSSILDDGFSW